MRRFLTRPLPVALLLGLASELLFAWRVTVPDKPVFDEVHYLPAARALLTLEGPRNIEHPLVGKELIALGIRLFGDDPLGWRLPSTLAATGVIVGIFAILWLAYRELRTALVGSVAVLLNFTVMVQARIAMLDGFLAAFVVLAVAALLWAMRASGAAVWWRWALGAALLGLATGCKWLAAPYVGFAALAFALLKRRDPTRWPGLDVIPAWAMLGGIGGVTYFLTFLPAFFYASDAMTLGRLLPFQLTMFHLQTQVLPAHPYQSSWWSWALDIRPIWYLYEPVDGAVRGILMLGNPAVFWGGLVAVAACLWAWARRGDERAGTVAGLWLGSYLIWAVIPKSLGFMYYYYLSSIWLGPAIAAAFRHWRARLPYWDETFLVVAAILFIDFYPILAATALSGPQAFHRWMWLHSWP